MFVVVFTVTTTAVASDVTTTKLTSHAGINCSSRISNSGTVQRAISVLSFQVLQELTSSKDALYRKSKIN